MGIVNPDGLAVHNGRGQVVGRLVRDARGRLWLEKPCLDPARHQLRQPPAWATDAGHLDLLRAHNGVGVRLVLTTGAVLEAPLEAFGRHGLELDRGFGRQIALPLRYWTVHRPGAQQLALFEGVAS